MKKKVQKTAPSRRRVGRASLMGDPKVSLMPDLRVVLLGDPKYNVSEKVKGKYSTKRHASSTPKGRRKVHKSPS